MSGRRERVAERGKVAAPVARQPCEEHQHTPTHTHIPAGTNKRHGSKTRRHNKRLEVAIVRPTANNSRPGPSDPPPTKDDPRIFCAL